MDFQAWLGEQTKQWFVEQFYYRQPHSGRCTSAAQLALGSWESVATILAANDADVMIVRRNEQRDVERPSSLAAAQGLVAEGCTLLVKHAERHHPQIAELAAAFARDFAAPVNVHLYVTPGDEFGFSWHYDAEEVFILQTSGRKEYSLRKNTVNPWPIEETLPANMQYEREIMPLMKCTLAAGDWLYVPSGWWHKGAALAGEPAISLAIGIMPRTGVDVFDLLRREVLQSLLWRQRLPVAGAASPLDAAGQRVALEELLNVLADDLSKLLRSKRVVDQLLP
jgi:50S ribosomal protein L16 3-hydroxylase